MFFGFVVGLSALGGNHDLTARGEFGADQINSLIIFQPKDSICDAAVAMTRRFSANERPAS